MRILAPFMIMISLFAANFAAVRVVAEESDAPYIFYYGSGDIVIERADGTNRTVIGADLDVWPMVNLTWSSSGRWIAWDNIVYNAFGEIETDTITIAAASYNGEHSFSIDIPVLYYDFDWRWSPTEDWILVSNIGMGSGPTIANSQVIDVASGEVLLALDDVEGYPTWSLDGQTIKLDHYEYLPSATDPEQVETIRTRTQIGMNGDRNGTTSVVQPTFWISENTFISWDTAQGSYFIDGPDFDAPAPIQSPSGMRIQYLYWNRTRDLALVYALEPVSGSDRLYEQNFYLLSLADRTITFINTFRISPIPDQPGPLTTIYQVNWSPVGNAILVYAIDGYPTYINRFYNENGWGVPSLNLYLVTLPIASIDLVTPHVMELTYGGPHAAPTPIQVDWTPWTPDGSRFLFGSGDGLNWYDVQSHQTSSLNLSFHRDIYGHQISLPRYGLNWADDGETAILTWLHDSWLYDAATDTLSTEPLSQHSLSYISPDGNFAVSLVACDPPFYHRNGPVLGNCLMNLETGERTDLVETDGMMVSGGGVASWHPTEPWVIMITDHSARYAYFDYRITDTTGHFYRYVLNAVDYWGTVEWLPENVPIDD